MRRAAGTGGGPRFGAVVIALALGGCHKVPREAPPRAHDRVEIPAQSSLISVPIGADLDELAATLNDAVPRRLWTIDKPDQVCAAPKKVKVLFAKITTPTVKCRIVGAVTRGAMTVAGAGRDIVVTLPLHATVSARDIGGIVKQETAEADARVRARVRLSLARDWTPHGTVAIAYDWTDTPHVDFLGQRIDFTSKADAKLQGVIAKLERTLPQELAKLHFRERVAQAWRSAFTALEVNKSNPTVWMRITPRALNYGGYRIERNRVTLRLGMQALTETFVGPRPPDPKPTPLPPAGALKEAPGSILFAIPVIGDYHQLEPVLAKALAKRARRPFSVPGIGAVTATFEKVTIYGTEDGKIAVGLTFRAAPAGDAPSHGTIWMTAHPTNATNSRRVAFTDLSVAGVTDSTGASLLIKLANAPGLSATIADSLTQNFSKDYQELLAKIGNAIAEKREGDLVIRARIDQVRTGQIQATGQGVYLPVWGSGTATIELQRRE